KQSTKGDRMNRRDFIALLGSTAVAWPLAARVIGFLAGAFASAATVTAAGLRQGLPQTGYVEGQNLPIGFPLAGGRLRAISRISSRIGEPQCVGDYRN